MPAISISAALSGNLRLLRLPFSFFLLPVTLFSFLFVQPAADLSTLTVLVVWHLLVYPSSNGYNSYHDRDTTPIAGLERPPLPQSGLLASCNALDSGAILLSLLLNTSFALFVAIYILFSRLYSNRSVRLKRFPVTGFLVVFIFQGAWIFIANCLAFEKSWLLNDPAVLCAAAACSVFTGSVYPLTQIYQHQSDADDGVTTLSMLLGIKGTFCFAAILMAAGSALMGASFLLQDAGTYFLVFMCFMLPLVLLLGRWMLRAFRDECEASYKNTMQVLIASAVLQNLFFSVLLIVHNGRNY